MATDTAMEPQTEENDRIFDPDLAEWAEPPSRAAFGGKYEAHKAVLKDNPGRSKIVSEHTTGKAANSAAGSFRKSAGFVAQVRKENGRHHLYVKYDPSLVAASAE